MPSCNEPHSYIAMLLPAVSYACVLQLCIMYMKLCPDGAEGASYSMLTTFGNIALVCASSLGTLAAGLW